MELSRELMAGFALVIFWIHVLLIAGSAGLDLRELVRLRTKLGPAGQSGAAGLFRAKVRQGVGPRGALALHAIGQVGRSKGDGKVHFSDVEHRSELFGGALELEDGTHLTVESLPARVWPDPGRRARAAAPDSPEQIEEAEPRAKRGSGYVRDVELWVEPDDECWIAGRVVEAAEGRALVPGPVGDWVLITAIEPRRWLRMRSLVVVGFVLTELILAGVCTVVALWPPVFGPVSIVGALAALGFFLVVQPCGVALNEWVQTPDVAALRGVWVGSSKA